MRKIFVGSLAVILVIVIASCSLAKGLEGKLDRSRRNYNDNDYYSNGGVTNNYRSVLPRHGDIAVVVTGDDSQHVRITESIIVEMLADKGYRVVDEAKMRKIRQAAARAKAARYALEGNVEAILKINASYSAAATIIARVQAGYPVVNEFGLYTGTSSVALMAVTSGGRKLGGKTSMGKQVGYTEDEAQYKSILSAVESGMYEMF
ncbi:MAG: hypothetical protein IJP48_11255 [Synergistaceae bacterium]|nr:hypothetical protein [Synergistaceae bacterium]